MNTTLIFGSIIATVALMFYTIAIILEQRTKRATFNTLLFLSLGVLLNITAAIFMKESSLNSTHTLHDILGYIALSFMLIFTLLMWIFKIRKGNLLMPSSLHSFAVFTYLIWVVVYISGSIIAMIY